MRYFTVLIFCIFMTKAFAYNLQDGIQAYDKRKDNLAVKIFKGILKKNHRNYVAQFNLASVFYSHKKYNAALKHYKIVSKSKSKLRLPSIYYIAEIYYTLKIRNQSIHYLDKLKNDKLPQNLAISVNNLYKSMGIQKKLNTKQFWGSIDLSISYSDNLNLDSNFVTTTKVSGLEFGGDFLVGYDFLLNSKQSISPSINYYLGKELRSLGYNYNGYVIQLNYKNKLSNENKISIKPSLQKEMVLGAPYLTRKNLQFMYNSKLNGKRYYLKYKFQSISEDQTKYAYLSGNAHKFYGKYYTQLGRFNMNFAFLIKLKSLNDLPTKSSSYNGFVPKFTLSYKYLDKTNFNFNIKYELRYYTKLETTQTDKRSDKLLTMSIGGQTKSTDKLSYYYSIEHTSNSSNLNIVSNSKEYTDNIFTLGVLFDF